jgi:methylmalonyl-CoA mutase C-terminal domain/subunit
MSLLNRPIRVVIAKAGLDGHERGAHAVTTMLRDAGMETIYLGMFRTPAQIVAAALEEDADVIGLSSLNGQHLAFSSKVRAEMDDQGLDDVLLVVGGVFPVEDVPRMKDIGVDQVFSAGTLMTGIIEYLESAVGARDATS